MSQQQEAPAVQPAPVPTVWGMDHTLDGNFVVLVANTNQGQSVFFLGHQVVDQFCDALLAQAAAAEGKRSGLQMPMSVVLGPDGNPMIAKPMGARPPVEEEPDAEIVPLTPTYDPAND